MRNSKKLRTPKYLILLLVLVSTMLIGSCDRRSNNPFRPDFNNPDWLSSFDSALQIEAVGGKDRFTATLRTKNDPGSSSLKIGGASTIEGSTEYNEILEQWITTFPNGGAYAGSTINYELMFSGKTYSGNLQMPSPINVAFTGFVPSADYSFSWVCSVNPHAFIFSLDYVYNNVFYSIRKQIYGSTRSFTIRKSEWNESPISTQLIRLQAINYNTSAKNLVVYAITADQY